jgi:hypothetical protein
LTLDIPLTLLLLAVNAGAPEPPRKVEVTGAMVEMYVPTRQRIVEATIVFYRQLKDEDARRRAAGQKVTTAQLDELKKRGKAHDDAMKNLERDSGLSADAWKATGRLCEEVGSERAAWRLAGGDEGIARTESSMKAKLAGLSEAQRAQVLDQMTGGLRRAKNAEKSRKIWGDALVDQVIRVAEPLERQKLELQKLAASS